MAKLEALSVEVTLVKFMLVIFPLATYSKAGDLERLTIFGSPVYKRCGDVLLLTVLGLPVYKRVDGVKSLFGFVWGSNAA